MQDLWRPSLLGCWDSDSLRNIKCDPESEASVHPAPRCLTGLTPHLPVLPVSLQNLAVFCPSDTKSFLICFP